MINERNAIFHRANRAWAARHRPQRLWRLSLTLAAVPLLLIGLSVGNASAADKAFVHDPVTCVDGYCYDTTNSGGGHPDGGSGGGAPNGGGSGGGGASSNGGSSGSTPGTWSGGQPCGQPSGGTPSEPISPCPGGNDPTDSATPPSPQPPVPPAQCAFACGVRGAGFCWLVDRFNNPPVSLFCKVGYLWACRTECY